MWGWNRNTKHCSHTNTLIIRHLPGQAVQRLLISQEVLPQIGFADCMEKAERLSIISFGTCTVPSQRQANALGLGRTRVWFHRIFRLYLLVFARPFKNIAKAFALRARPVLHKCTRSEMENDGYIHNIIIVATEDTVEEITVSACVIDRLLQYNE